MSILHLPHRRPAATPPVTLPRHVYTLRITAGMVVHDKPARQLRTRCGDLMLQGSIVVLAEVARFHPVFCKGCWRCGRCGVCGWPVAGLLADCQRPQCVIQSAAAEAAAKRLEDW